MSVFTEVQTLPATAEDFHSYRKGATLRRNGRYRQPYVTRNRNRAMRAVVDDGTMELSLIPPETLVVEPVRDITFEVPVKLWETPAQLDVAEGLPNQCGALMEHMIPVVTADSYESMMAAFNKRCNFEAQEGDDIGDTEFEDALAVIRGMRGDFEPWEENDVDWHRWIKNFTPAKQAAMTAGREEIYKFSDKELGKKDLSVKVECLLKRYDPTWAPRVIYVGTDGFNAITGPAMKVAMERLISLLTDRGDATHLLAGLVEIMVAYKTNDVALVEYLDDVDFGSDPTVEGDFSANDREQRARVCLLFDAFLEKIRMPQWLRRLLIVHNCFQVSAKKYGLKAKIKDQLPTGTTLTTCRNSTYNMVMFAVSVCRQYCAAHNPTVRYQEPVYSPDNKPQAKAVVLGDDILARIRAWFAVSIWVSHVTAFRMKLKGKKVRLYGEATFLSRRLCFGADGGFLVPLIGKALARFNVRAIQNEAFTDSQYMAGKALSYAYEFRHVPCISSIFQRRFLMEDTSKIDLAELSYFTKLSGLQHQDLINAIDKEAVLVSDETFRDWIVSAYNIGLADALEIIEGIVLCKHVTTYSHPEIHNFDIDF